MVESPGLDDEEIRRLLEGSEAEIRAGVGRISDRYCGIVCGGMRRSFRWISPEDLADVWQSTLLAVLEKALTRELDVKRPLIGLLWVIATRRCCDVLNAAARRKAAFQAFSETVAEVVGPDDALRVEWAEAFHVLDKAILGLPPVQRAIWLAYQGLGFCATDEELAPSETVLSYGVAVCQCDLVSVRRPRPRSNSNLEIPRLQFHSAKERRARRIAISARLPPAGPASLPADPGRAIGRGESGGAPCRSARIRHDRPPKTRNSAEPPAVRGR